MQENGTASLGFQLLPVFHLRTATLLLRHYRGGVVATLQGTGNDPVEFEFELSERARDLSDLPFPRRRERPLIVLARHWEPLARLPVPQNEDVHNLDYALEIYLRIAPKRAQRYALGVWLVARRIRRRRGARKKLILLLGHPGWIVSVSFAGC